MTLVLTDIDGTIVHYDDTQSQAGRLGDINAENGTAAFVSLDGSRSTSVITLPPSTTGVQGAISLATLQKAAVLRTMGCKLAVLTGARTSTLMQRLAFLPAADAFASENGGRLFVLDASWPTAVRIREDMQWRARHNATAGPASQEREDPVKRVGVLWHAFREFHAHGWHLDANSYTTSFRVKVKPPHTAEQLQEMLRQLPAGLKSSFNLGSADIYPATSGKEEVAKYLAQKYLGSEAAVQQCLFMCDDDNDMPLARLVSKVFLPNISTASVEAAVQQNPSHFVMVASKGVFATEDILNKVIQCVSDGATAASMQRGSDSNAAPHLLTTG